MMQSLRRIWPGLRLVRVVSFNKSTNANWGVPWHQDRVICVQEKAELPGFDNWSRKAGQWHCEPPLSLLQNMLFTRLHLDDSHEENGAMEIALRSHLSGKIAAGKAEQVAQAHETELTLGAAGDLHVLNMLPLHRSRPATQTTGRRVLRLDFARQDLPAPFQWVF